MKNMNLSIISRYYSCTRNEGRADKSNAIGYSRRTGWTRRTRRTRCVTEKHVGYSCCHVQEAPAAQADPNTNTHTSTFQLDIQADLVDQAVPADTEDQEDQADPADQVSQ
jgi:hypothetical protein